MRWLVIVSLILKRMPSCLGRPYIKKPARTSRIGVVMWCGFAVQVRLGTLLTIAVDRCPESAKPQMTPWSSSLNVKPWVRWQPRRLPQADRADQGPTAMPASHGRRRSGCADGIRASLGFEPSVPQNLITMKYARSRTRSVDRRWFDSMVTDPQ